MQYSEYRDHAETGDLVLCSGNSKLSKAIKVSAKRNKKKPVFDNVYYSHIGVLIHIYGHMFIIEANGRTVDLRRFSDAYKKYTGRIDIYRPVYLDQHDTVVPGSNLPPVEMFISHLLNLEGKKYDWGDILQQLFNEIDFLRKKHDEDGQYYCSELVNAAALYYWGGEDKWISPHDIGYREWKSNNFICTLENIR